jgi:hypothetical protein
MKRTLWIIIILAILSGACFIFLADPAGASKAGAAGTVKDYVDSLRVRSGETYKNLTIFPLTSAGAETISNMMMLDEAIKKGALTVTEYGGGDVNNLLAENTSSKKIFIMAGEILTGAKQDRVLKDDVLLPAHSGKVKLACYCVEHGRWSYSGGDQKFSTKATASNINVRQAAREKKEQGEVWGAVAETQSKVAAAPAAGALDKTYDAPTVSTNISSYVEHLRNLPDRHPGTVGVVVVIEDEVLCADIFANERMFETLWPKLLKSYALEALGRGKDRGANDTDLAKSFLRRLESADFETQSTPGLGKLVEFTSSKITGSALVYNDAVPHVDMFPKMKETTRKKPGTDEPPIQRQYQQNQYR